MAERVLTLRELNRALLTRQMLLKRQPIDVLEAVEKLVGLQAQVPNPPYIGLWTRLESFARADLTTQMEQRQIVRAALMRSTLHLMTAADHNRFRTALQPALAKALNAFFGQRARGLDIERLCQAARPFIEAQPRTTGELRAHLLSIVPDADGEAMAYAVRNFLPLIQIPPGGTWGSGAGSYATSAQWLGEPVSDGDHLGELLFRYLAAFGPASVMDFQTWTGITKLGGTLDPFRRDLITLRDEQGRELLDLPGQPLPPGDTPAPVRFIPEYDNLLIAHADRTRIIADEDRPKVFLSAGRVRSTVLVDGFVAGAWKIEKARKAAALVIEPFRDLDDADQSALAAEGERLVSFVEDQAEAFEVRFV
jgi:hypothetical protein